MLHLLCFHLSFSVAVAEEGACLYTISLVSMLVMTNIRRSSASVNSPQSRQPIDNGQNKSTLLIRCLCRFYEEGFQCLIRRAFFPCLTDSLIIRVVHYFLTRKTPYRPLAEWLELHGRVCNVLHIHYPARYVQYQPISSVRKRRYLPPVRGFIPYDVGSTGVKVLASM